MRLSISDRGMLCLDWDERSLRVLDARISRAGVQIKTAVHVPLAPGTDVRDPASIGDFLRRTLGEHRIRTRRAVVDIPRQDAVLNMMSLPRGSPDELAAMVHIQIAKDLPFSKEQAVVDFAVAHAEGGTCELWVAAVRNHVIDHYQRVIRAAGLKLDRIGLRPYANLAAMRGDEVAPGRTLTIDVGPSMTEINVIRDGRLVFSRAASVSVSRGGLLATSAPPEREPRDESALDGPGSPTIPLVADLAPRPGAMDALLIEISRTVEAYRATDLGATFDRIVLSGTAGIDEHVRRAFEKRFSVPARLFEAPLSLNWQPGGGLLAVPFIAVIGLAVSSQAPETECFDLLHPKEPEAGRRERARRVPVAGVTAALFVAAASVAAYQSFRPKYAEIERLTAEIERVDKDSNQRKDFMKKYEDLQDWQSRSVIWIDALQRVAKVFPSNKEAYITDMDCDEQGRIELALAAKDRMVATKFINQVESVRKDGRLLGSVSAEFAGVLDEGKLSPGLREALAGQKLTLGSDARVLVEEKGTRWSIGDGDQWYAVVKDKNKNDLKAHKTVALFEAEPGDLKSDPKNPEYPFKDTVTIQIKALKKK